MSIMIQMKKLRLLFCMSTTTQRWKGIGDENKKTFREIKKCEWPNMKGDLKKLRKEIQKLPDKQDLRSST